MGKGKKGKEWWLRDTDVCEKFPRVLHKKKEIFEKPTAAKKGQHVK